MVDPEARFAELYRRHYPRLLGYAARRIGHDEAQDVVADAFALAWGKLAQVPAERELAWLLTTARHLIANRLRALDRFDSVAHLLESERRWHPDEGERADQRVDVARLLAKLPPNDREVLLLAEWDDVPITVGAAVLGCSQTAYGVRLHRARRRFAQLVALSGLVAGDAGPGPVPEHHDRGSDHEA